MTSDCPQFLEKIFLISSSPVSLLSVLVLTAYSDVPCCADAVKHSIEIRYRQKGAEDCFGQTFAALISNLVRHISFRSIFFINLATQHEYYEFFIQSGRVSPIIQTRVGIICFSSNLFY